MDFIASVYPGKSDYSNGGQKEHKKIKKSVHYTLWKFIVMLTNHLPATGTASAILDCLLREYAGERRKR